MATPNTKRFEDSNKKYQASFTSDLTNLALPPSKKVAVIACMDARLDPAKALGLHEGDAHVIRNAGGRSYDALRSIIISQRLLGTTEIVILHHTDCGMLTFNDGVLREKLAKETGSTNVDQFSFYSFGDLEQSVKDDARFLKENEYVLDVPVTGYIYDVKSGAINKVEL